MDAISQIEQYLSGVDFQIFNRMMSDAVFRQLEIVGEAAGRLSTEFQMNHPEIPYRQAKDMRNFLIHEYFGVNIEAVWDTCKDDLPKLKLLIQKILND